MKGADLGMWTRWHRVLRTAAILVALVALAASAAGTVHYHNVDQQTAPCAACLLASTPAEATTAIVIDVALPETGEVAALVPLPAAPVECPSLGSRGPPASC